MKHVLQSINVLKPLGTMTRRAIALLVMLIGLWGISFTPALADGTNLAEETGPIAKAIVKSTDDSSTILGEAVFAEVVGGVEVSVALSNVPPGYHGFHIHEFGSCDNGGSAAGGHFNPLGVEHGQIVTDGYEHAHVGDLGNIVIDDDGTGTLAMIVPNMPLTDDELAIANHAVILHADQDDFGQPTGNAGGRIGCGVIEIIN